MSAIDTGNQEQFDNFTTSHLGLEPKVSFESIISLKETRVIYGQHCGIVINQLSTKV